MIGWCRKMYKAKFNFCKKKIVADYEIKKKDVKANFNLNITPSISNFVTKEELNRATATYVHTQAVASKVWVINHNLNKQPSVFAVDSAEAVQIPDDIIYDSNNTVTVKFLSEFSGKAYLN